MAKSIYEPYGLGFLESSKIGVFICIFMEDNESEWTETERSDFLNGKCFPALEWLVGQADYYEAELTCTLAYYNDTVKYEGVYGDFNNGVNPLILQDAALALGYTSEEEMQQDLFYQYDVEQVAFIVAMDKPGRCYASIDTYNDNYIRMEHAVLFDDTAYFDGLYYSCDVSTVAHELLHLFGAEDYYSEGTDRNGRAALAESWFYHDVMLRTYSDVSYNSVGPVTAYSVGWRDISHVVLTDEQWWN